MTPPSGPSPLVGLVAALAVLIAGIAAAATRDDSTSARTAPGIVASTRPLPSSTTTSTPRPTFSTLPPTALSTTTTVRPAVPTPEAAANGLWAAYTSGDRGAANRFASPAVADALFATPFPGEDGTFQGCAPRQTETFDCEYLQPSTRYTMTAQADAAHSFKIVVISIAG